MQLAILIVLLALINGVWRADETAGKLLQKKSALLCQTQKSLQVAMEDAEDTIDQDAPGVQSFDTGIEVRQAGDYFQQVILSDNTTSAFLLIRHLMLMNRIDLPPPFSA